MAVPLKREPYENAAPSKAEDRREGEDDIFAGMTAADLISKLLLLPKQERAALAHELLKSLHDEPEDEEGTPEEIEAAWDAEIERRSAEIEDGTAKVVTWEEYEALMEQKLAARAKSDH